MIKLIRHATIDAATQAKLDKYKINDRPKRWNGRAAAVVEFKNRVLEDGLVIQHEKCSWCMLPVGEIGRRTAHRDHIAPKSKHPQWTFLPINLVISCEYCNGFAVKGSIDTIETSAASYEDCAFYVIHPYLDDPSQHLSFLPMDDGSKILIQSLSTKGTWTIEKLKLDTPGATIERAKEYLYQQHTANLSQTNQELLRAAVLALGQHP